MPVKKTKTKAAKAMTVAKQERIPKKTKSVQRAKSVVSKVEKTRRAAVKAPVAKIKKVLDKKPRVVFVAPGLETMVRPKPNTAKAHSRLPSATVLPEASKEPISSTGVSLKPEVVLPLPPRPVIKPGPQVPIPPKVEKPVPKVQPPLQPAAAVAPRKEELKTIEINIPVVLKDLAAAIQEKPAFLIKRLLEYKIIAHINQSLDEELARRVASQYGYQIIRKPTADELLFIDHQEQDPTKLRPRPPIVTFMGHVDHGKTSLLDAVRKSKVVEAEYGGITQHIGAYAVNLPGGKITFLDTPGHEAFTAMRARGAKITDIVVLVVAADDGVMPQTIEAIDHAREAKVPIIVAINKIDKPQADIDVVKKQLSKLDLSSEDWGGKTITVGVSAKTGQGIDELLEMILLEAEMLELRASPDKLAKGVVLEAKVTEGRGLVATLLVGDGTLHVQDTIIAGPHHARIRAMFNEFAKPIKEAAPSTPVEILGISGLPEAGEQFFALADEKKAKELASRRREQLREKELKPIKTMTLEGLSSQIKEGKVKELKLILKADVGGSLEAINESFKKLENAEVKLNIIHQGVGSINVSDVILAYASGAIILGFHVVCDDRSREEADKSGIDIRTYNVIYELFNDLKTALEGMLEPRLKKVFLGRLIVRQVFRLTKTGIVAGCYLEKGKIIRLAKVSLLRNGAVVFEGAISSLRRFKDDVREVGEGLECGVSLSGFDDIMQGDIIEAYEIEKIVRKLE